MTEKKKNSVLGGILDLIILVLIVGGAGYFGYITGLNQRLAPVQLVPAGTLGAIWPAKENGPAKPETPASSEASAQASNQNSKSSETVASAETETASSPATAKPSGTSTPKGKTKYWLVSSGEEYIGSSITAKVNGDTVDIFFAPGKSIDISRKIKSGKNTLTFECKALEEGYNKHPGDASFALSVKLVSGPTIRDDFAPSAVLFTFKRTAADTKDATETKTFTAKE